MPTAMLVNHKVSLKHAKRGWPTLLRRRKVQYYAGPLARQCACKDKTQHTKLVRPSAATPSLTGCTVQWLLREALREHLTEEPEERLLKNGETGRALHGGGGQESDSNDTWHSDSTVQESLRPHCDEDPQLMASLGMADQVLLFLNSAFASRNSA